MDETKNLRIEDIHLKLTETLHELAKKYSALFEIVTREKDLLITADIEQLQESNKTKAALIFSVRQVDLDRQKWAQLYGDRVGLKGTGHRLLEIASKLKGDQAEELKALHSQLETIIRRVTESNKENETYAQSALKVLNGAMGEIKDTLGGKKTYQRKGQMKTGPDNSGNFVSKEA